MTWLTSAFIAHRGLHSGNSDTPENSLKAYSKAVQNGYAIELDVRLSKDNKLVVFHDADLKRMCSIDKNVESLNLEELQKLNLLGSKETIPTLKEVFDFVNCKTPILIEIKSENTKTGIIESKLIDELSYYKGEVAVQSFNPFSLRWFKKNAPNILRGQLSSSFKGEKLPAILKYVLKYMIFNIITKPDFIAYEKEDISKSYLQKLRKSGKILLCWTIKNPSEKDKALPYCDNIIFEGFTP